MKIRAIHFVRVFLFLSSASASAGGFYTGPCGDLHQMSANSHQALLDCVNASLNCKNQSQDYLQALTVEHQCETKNREILSSSTPVKNQ